MIRPVSLSEIKGILLKNPVSDLLQTIEDGFVMYSQKKVIVPPVGYLGFKHPPGDVHIKYGYIEGDDYYVIKIASGFYNNPAIGLPTGNGMMLLFSQKTGETLSILLDEGYLTDIRTAVAGAVAAKYLAPASISCIGIVGTGMQARLQLEYLKAVTSCRKVIVWGRSEDKLKSFKAEPSLQDFSITTTTEIISLTSRCNLIVTTTPSRKALVMAAHIHPGTHITAVGADAEGKQEIDPMIFEKADVIVADSKDQCIDHGDISYAVKGGMLDPENILELGDVIHNKKLRRNNDQQITIADLTGVAIQDIQITKYVHLALTK
jgi:ornithine cyclodeaminase